MMDAEWIGVIAGWPVAMLGGAPLECEEQREMEEALSAARASGRPLMWDLLRARLQLTPTEQAVLCMLIAVEVSLDVRAFLSRINEDERRSAVDVALLSRTVYARSDSPERIVTELSPRGALLRFRLIEPVGRSEERPLLLRQFRPTQRVVELVHGERDLDPELEGLATLVDRPHTHEHLLVSPELKARAAELAMTLDRRARMGDRAPVLVVSGREGSGRRSLLEGIAADMGRALLVIDCSRFADDATAARRQCSVLLREALIFEAIPVLHGLDTLRAEPRHAESARLIEECFVRPSGSLVTATALHGVSRPAALSCGFVVVELGLPDESDRRRLWERELGDRAQPTDTAWAAERFRVTGGVIQRAARAALSETDTRAEAVHRGAIHAGVRAALDAQLSGIASRVSVTQTWDDLVLPPDTLEELREIVARVRHRGTVLDQWGLGDKIGKGHGVSVLFSGPPGTGKTMVACIIAAELGLDLYRIDLAQIVSKYIGETEKNLASMFDAAEAGHAVLLFDEADALFAKRTDVRSSNDRYSNMEVNFLLQRLETFTGISILTTNLESSIDEAFKRRLSFRIAFTLPEQEERERLWRTLLPPRAQLAPNIQFDRLAERFEMSGGYIKNAVVRAAFMAADRGSPIDDALLFRAATLEYASMGKVMHAV